VKEGPKVQREVMFRQKDKKMNLSLKHVSFSSLTAYENCPRCFYLKYGLKIWEETKSDALLFGGELHDQIAEYHGHRKPAWKARLDGVRPEAIRLEVEPYFKIYTEAYPKKAEAVEKEFLITFRHPNTGQNFGIPIKGVLDLVNNDCLIEHKTSSARYTKRQVHDMMQLTLYQCLTIGSLLALKKEKESWQA